MHNYTYEKEFPLIDLIYYEPVRGWTTHACERKVAWQIKTTTVIFQFQNNYSVLYSMRRAIAQSPLYVEFLS